MLDYSMDLKTDRLSPEEVLNLISTLDVELANRLSRVVDLEEYSRKLSANARFIIGYADTNIVGLLAFYENSDKNELYVPYVCTSHQYRRRGFAHLLMSSLINYADTTERSITLEVLDTNSPAISFYRKMGFETIGAKGDKFIMKRFPVIK